MTVGVVALRTVWLGAVTPHMAAPQVLQNLACCSFDRPHFVQKAMPPQCLIRFGEKFVNGHDPSELLVRVHI